jgi:SulP family sulfate permease
MAGVIILLTGLLRLGRVVALIPTPVISGFTSGIAVIIALGQVDNLLGMRSDAVATVMGRVAGYLEHGVDVDSRALTTGLLVMLVMIVWPRLPWGTHLPGSLLAIVSATAVAWGAGWEIPTIGAIPRTIVLDDRLTFAGVAWDQVRELVVPAFSIAALGAIESLLCATVGGNMTGVRPHNNLELVAQGIGNILIPFFGGVPATAAIARSSVAVRSGARTRLTGMLHGVLLLLAALAFAPVIGRVPLAALAGVLVITAWRMNEWHAIQFFFGRRLKHAMAAFLITLAATVLLDLTQAILIGFAVSSLVFMAQMSDLQVSREPVAWDKVGRTPDAAPLRSATVYYLSGALFFAAARRLLETIERHDGPDATLILSMRGVPLIDATGVSVLREIDQHLQQGGGELLVSGLSVRVEKLLRRSGFLDELGEERLFWSADRAIAALGARPPQTAGAVEDVTEVRGEMVETLEVVPFADRAGREEGDF